MPDEDSFYRPGVSIKEFHDDAHWIRVLIGGRGCISGYTPLYDPVDGTTLTAKERADSGIDWHTYAEKDGQRIVCRAMAPWKKGTAPLITLQIQSFEYIEITCTHDHEIKRSEGHSYGKAGDFGLGADLMIVDGERRTFGIVVGIKEAGEGDFYDITVPEAGNYVIGGTVHKNSGKTAATVMEATRHCWLNAGAKCLFVRKTELSQVDSTIDSMLLIFAELDPELYTETDDSLFKTWNDGRTVRLPSDQAVRRYHAAKRTLKTKAERKAWLDTEGAKWCGFIEFRGLPHATVNQSKLRGFECSFMALIEADQMAHQDFMLSLACLRWKGADPETCDENGFIIDTCVILDTNPPGKDHWIAKLEEEELKKPEAQQEMRFWHISTYENEHNLPPDYIKRQILLPYAHNQPMIDRMLYGKYADAFSGAPVYHAFNVGEHVGENLPWPIGAYLVRGWDFGTCNYVSWAAYWRVESFEYWHVLYEQYLEGSDVERQAREAIRHTQEEFPFWNDRNVCSGIMDFCDPSGNNSNFSTAATGSSVKILNTHGIFPGTNLIDRTIAWGNTIINRMLELRDRDGIPCFKIDRVGCPILHRAFAGGYRYPEPGETGKPDEPLKGLAHQVFDYSHAADGHRYSALNVWRLAKEAHEQPLPANFVRRKNPNPVLTLNGPAPSFGR